MRTNLKVPFPEKEEAKKLGARWDAARKLWYVQDADDLSPFARWSPSPHHGPASTPAKQTAAKPQQQSVGKMITGANFVEHTPICDCLPWDSCGQCEATALRHAGVSHG